MLYYRTTEDIAKHCWITAGYLREIRAGRKPLTKKIARKLEEFYISKLQELHKVIKELQD